MHAESESGEIESDDGLSTDNSPDGSDTDGSESERNRSAGSTRESDWSVECMSVTAC